MNKITTPGSSPPSWDSSPANTPAETAAARAPSPRPATATPAAPSSRAPGPIRFPAKVSVHIQKRLENLPKPIQDIGWKAQVRLCKRYRRLTARGKHPNVAVTAVARELAAFMWAIAREVPITA